MKLTVVSPTFNEVANVPRLIAELQKSLQGIDHEILIADDNSPDGTWAKVDEIGKTNPSVRCLRRMTNPGLAPAVIEGFEQARGNAIACIDADLQHDPAVLPRMLDALEQGSDVVVGSRYVAGGGTGEWNWFRRFQSWVATKLAQVFLGVQLHDPMSGYFMMRREDFLRVRQGLNAQGFKILLEIAAKLKPKSVKEVPYTFRTRTEGESKLSNKVIFQYLSQLWRLSKLGRLLPVRFLKFAIVGGTGVVVNLAALVVIVHTLGFTDWRASAAASGVATLSNYVLNNVWTFRDRAHTGISVIRGYVFYLLVSLVGLAINTGVFVGLKHALSKFVDFDHLTLVSTLALMLCQLVGVLVGTYSNYRMNRMFTWPRSSEPSP